MAELSARTRLPIPLSSRRVASPSLSPTRRYRRQQSTLEDVPYDVSPSSILQAFTDGSLPPPDTCEYRYLLCSKDASSAQKSIAVRVAKVALNVRDWCLELKQWSWPGTFATPLSGDEGKDALAYLGSLPSILVESYETRIDEIHVELEDLGIKELKNYIAEIHGSRSRPTSSYEDKRVQLNLMDDFSLLITGALIQTLPLLAQLNQEIDAWNTRLSILRGVPIFLKHLDEGQRGMGLAWQAITLPADNEISASFVQSWKDNVNAISLAMKRKVSDLGCRVDGMLDSLETREDTIPDDWIDDFEALEAEYGRWEVEARKRCLELDLRLLKTRTTSNSLPVSVHPIHPLPSPAQSESSKSDAFGTPGKVEPNIGSITPNDSKRNSFDPAPTQAEPFTAGDGIGEASRLGDLQSEFGKSNADPPQDDAEVDRPRTPEIPIPYVEVSPSYSLESQFSSPITANEESPSLRPQQNLSHDTNRGLPPLNSQITKRRGQRDLVITKSLNDAQDLDLEYSRAAHYDPPSPTGTVDLDAQISNILTTVPANIRLTSSTSGDVVNRTARTLSGTQALQRLRASRSFVKSPELTLTRAKSEHPSHRRGGGDPNIKLYHLIQPGHDKPIKLFIRSVGENGERVMVRVGGGWADLGEYLRQYAEHHGRRTVSEGKLEVLSSAGDTSSSVGSGSPHANKSTPRGGSISPMDTPTKARDISSATPSQVSDPEANNTTPDSIGSTSASRTSWKGEEVGLAGPTTKKLDLSEEKREWINSMMNQARKISSGALAPKVANSNEKDFGDLGKMGGTKRVWMRAPSRQGQAGE